MADWTDEELRAAVRGYLAMLEDQVAGKPYSKAEYRRVLMAGPLSTRSAPSIEYRMRNISAVMRDDGRAIVQGYVPAQNVGGAIKARLLSLLKEEGEAGA